MRMALVACSVRQSLCSFDCDGLRALLGLGRLRKLHSQYALGEGRFDLVGINGLGQPEGALKRAIVALGEVVILLLFFLAFFFSPLIVNVPFAGQPSAIPQ